MIPHSLTLLLEGQAYIVAMLAAYQQGLAFICPRTVGAQTHWRGYCAGLRRTGSLYLLVTILLAVSAVYETLEAIYVGPLLAHQNAGALATAAAADTATEVFPAIVTSIPLPTATAANTATVSPLRVTVDPRVELLSLIFRLAGNPEYNMGRVGSYAADADKRFKAFQDHPVVKLARRLHENHSVSCDACMDMAVHLTDAHAPQFIVPLDPWPKGLDRRWEPKDVTDFLAAARQFVQDSSFKQFIEQHRELYQTTELRMRELMEKEAHLEWFNPFFGEHPQAAFTVVPGLLNGPCNYGMHCRDTAGKEEMFCILGVSDTDWHGLPNFNREMLGTVVHEFSHSYANAIIDRHQAELAAAGKKLFAPVAAQMRSQGYDKWLTMLRESLVRASVVRYLRQYDGEQAARREIQNQKKRGFLWMEGLSNRLAEYEAQRERYPSLEAFAPRLVAFFNECAKSFDNR
jgi:hypothetical protein